MHALFKGNVMKLTSFALASRTTAAVAAGTALLALGGCMTSTPIWDAHFGEAVRTVTQAQIIDPHAAEHAQASHDMDGRAAVSAVDVYQKSFEAPTPSPNAFVIGVGSGSGGGAGQ